MKTLLIRLMITLSLMLLGWITIDRGAIFSAWAATAPANPQAALVSVLIELQAPSVTQIYAARQSQSGVQAAQTSAATQAQLATIEQAQQRLAAPLAALGAQVIYRNQRVYNGIAVRIAATKVEQLWSLADVKAVHLLVAKHPDQGPVRLSGASTPLSGAPTLWQGINGVNITGRGLKIAIIDTGVDYLHVDLGGPGVGYTTNDPTKANDVTGFPNLKVSGGYDFAGDDYNAEPSDASYQPIPAPDADPMDCYAHGTHVAGIAAGEGVNGDGTPYKGPYNSTTNFNQLKIPPGVAPQAQLYAVKVFGCTGSSEIVDQGIEWAVDPNGDGDLADHVDVINLSLGSSYGSLDDPTTIASENASAAGVIVVASAGNSTDVTYVTGSPAVGNHVISVAAGQTSVNGFETVASFSARGPRRFDAALKPDLTAPGFRVVSAASGTGNGTLILSGTSMAAPHVAGALALLRQIHPDWSVDALKALVMNSATTQIRVGETISATHYSPPRIGAGRLDLAQAQKTNVIAYNADDSGLVSLSFGVPEVLTNATVLKNLRLANQGDQPAAYTLSYAGVTDIPGVTFQWPTQTITVPVGGFANIPILFTADAAQMRHTRDQTLTTTQGGQARQSLSEKTGYLLLWPATGLLTATLEGTNVIPAISTPLHGLATFHYRPQTQLLSYTLQLSGTASLTNTVVTLNRGQAGINGLLAYTLTVGNLSPNTPLTGTINLAPADETLLRDGILYVNIATPDHPAGLLRGQINSSAPILAVPIYAAPRPAAAMHATPTRLEFTNTNALTQALTLQGIGLSGSQWPTEVISLVSAVGLQWRSPDLPPANPITGTEGSRVDLYDHADLKYVGVTSDFLATQTPPNPAGVVAQSMLYFGIATYGNWSTPNEVKFEIYLDTNRDGIRDYQLFNSDALGYNSNNVTSDAFMTALKDLHTGRLTLQAPLNATPTTTRDTAPYHTNVMLLPIQASLVGLTEANPSFDYQVESYSNDRPRASDGTRRAVDRSPLLHFNVRENGLDLTEGKLGCAQFQDLPGEKIRLGFALNAYAQSGLQGILLLHHHNITGQRDEIISIDYHWPNTVYLPLIEHR